MYENPQALLRQFVENFKKDHSNLSSLEPEELVEMIFDQQKKLLQECSLNDSIERVDSRFIQQLLVADPRLFIFRHGDQVVSDDLNLFSAARKKCEMMREKHNKEDGITIASAVDCITTLIVLKYLQEKTGRKFIVQTSQNQRAWIPAQVFASMLDVDCQHNMVWDCINYPSETAMPTRESTVFTVKQ